MGPAMSSAQSMQALQRTNALRRACGQPELPMPDGRWRDAKDALLAERVRIRDGIDAAVASYCREQLGYARVRRLDGMSGETHAVVLMQCGWGPNPDCRFALVYELATGRVVEDGVEEHEYWARKGSR